MIFVTDSEFMKSEDYLNFMSANPGKGNLKIRAYAASEALPVSGLHIIVSTVISGKNIIFYDGYTDTSGMINTLSLPEPEMSTNNLSIPITTTYNISAIDVLSGNEKDYPINMYDGICVVQNINFIPEGGNNGNSLSRST